MTFLIPLPPRDLSPNARVHWTTKARGVRAYKTDCRCLVRKAICEGLYPTTRPLFASAVVTLTIIKKRVTGCYLPRDGDNAIASIKAAIDSMTLEGLWQDDSPQFVTINPPVFETPRRSSKDTGIRVQIEEAD